MDISTDAVIAGGGPAGLMAGLLLARAGVDVVVLEKHADFLRDFRGDTIHPATQHLLHRIGLAEEFLARDHADTPRITLSWHGQELTLAEFTHLTTDRVSSCPCQLSVIRGVSARSEEHTAELQSRGHLVCRLVLEKNNIHAR